MRDDDIDLAELARLLKTKSLPTQVQIAKEIGADQAFVAHAKRGDLKRVTARVRRLHTYVIMRVRSEAVPQAVSRSVRAYLRGGGDPTLLVQQMEILGAAQTGRRPGRREDSA